MNALGGGASRSRSVAVGHSHERPRNRENLRWLLKELLTEHRLALLRLENTGKSPLLHFLGVLAYSASSNGLHLLNNINVWMHCTCAVACGCVHSTTHTWILVQCTSIRLLDCSFCLHYFIHGYNQVWPRAPSYEFYRCLWDFYKCLWEIDTSSWPIRSQYLLQLWSKCVLDIGDVYVVRVSTTCICAAWVHLFVHGPTKGLLSCYKVLHLWWLDKPLVLHKIKLCCTLQVKCNHQKNWYLKLRSGRATAVRFQYLI